MNWHDRLQLIAGDIERQRTPQAVVGAYLRAIRLDEVCTDGDYAALNAARQSGLDRLREERARGHRAAPAFDERDCGGVFDGNQVISDADPGL